MTDIVLVVDKLEQLGMIRPHRITGDWYQIHCPFHNGGREKKPSCGVLIRPQLRNGKNYPEGFCHCFSCGYAKPLPGMITDLLNNSGVATSGIEWLSQNIPGFDKSRVEVQSLIPEDTMQTILSKYAADNLRLRLNAQKSYVSEDELASYRYTVPYMYERGLTDAIIDRYDIGFDPNHIPAGRKKKLPCITFPVRDVSGKTLFCCRRSIEGKYFNYPTGVEKPVYGLYELPKDVKSVIICESCFNALTCVKYGFNAVALLGTGNSYQISQLQKLGVEFIICLDGDEAGMKGSEKLKQALSKTSVVWTMHMIPGEDVNSIDYATFMKLYNERD